MAAILVWNDLRFGSPFLTGLKEQTFGEPFLSGLLGLLVSPGKGIVWYVPLIFLLPWCVRGFYRRAPYFAALSLVLTVLPLAFYSNVVFWHGDPAWGPRYLYTAVPYLVLPLGEILTTWMRRARALRLTLLLLVVSSFLVQLSAITVTPWRFWYRIEAIEQRTRQPFHWGARRYHYYWDVRQSPLLIQPDNVYQVIRLKLGEKRYELRVHPGPPGVSNPADKYPINAFAFWWLDPRHPIFGSRTRGGLAALLGFIAISSLLFVVLELRKKGEHGGVTATTSVSG